MNLHALFYRTIMKVAHKYHWHYAPPIYPDGDTQLWCKWCGFRETIKKHNQKSIGELYGVKFVEKPDTPINPEKGVRE